MSDEGFVDLFDNMLQDYENEINSENQLVSENNYVLNKNLSCSVGLSATRGFIPVIKLKEQKKSSCRNISFIHIEWNELKKHLDNWHTHLNNKNVKNSYYKCPNCVQTLKRDIDANEESNKTSFYGEIFTGCKIDLISHFNGRNTVQITSRGQEIILDKKSFIVFKNVLPLLDIKLDSLQQLKFEEFYNNALLTVASKDDVIDQLKQLTQTYRYMHSNAYVECLLEIITFCEKKILRDINSLRTLHQYDIQL